MSLGDGASMEPANVGRDLVGRFAPGSHGNSAGKKPGTRNRVTTLLDRMAEKGATAVMEAVLTAAQKGDVSAATLLLTRLWPARKGRPIRLDLPALDAPGGALAALATITRMVADGEISCEEGASIASIVESHQKTADGAELLRRIERLEAALATATILPGHTANTAGEARRGNGSAAA
jgi:hypothetical protein